MRKRRSKLEVSTFPFLAVLLCTMGSLMLLLFIMDRRAKIAARYRVAEELQARRTRTKAEEEARQAEWEKAKRQLHLSLLQQQAQLRAEATGFQANLNDAGSKLALVQARNVGLEEKIKGESVKIGTLLLDIESRRAGLQQADKKVTMTKAELMEAAKELAELERAFLQLRALKERETQVHSVVPYRGKRGDVRTPIYVECVRDGVLFHPDRTSLQGLDFSPRGLRREIERRFGPLAIQKLAKDDTKGPYVLFLIRPDGIGNYYLAQAALKGFQLDFGYELVDAGWVLDFSGATHAQEAPFSRTQTPWKVGSDSRPTFVPSGGMASRPGSAGSPLFVSRPTGGLAAGTPGSGFGTGNPGARSTGPGSSGIGASLPAPPPGGSNVGSPLPAPPPGGSGFGSSLPAPPPNGNPSYVGSDAGSPAKPPAFVPIGKGTPNGTGASPGVNPNNAPTPGSNAGGQRSNGSGQPGQAPDESTGKLFPAYGAGRSNKPAAAPPLSKLLGNKDFIITIECRSDAVTVNPTGLIYRWTSSNSQATDSALAQTVTNLIARRQASVRPGEPPYRPQICFRVTPDGLRTYLHVYPLLEQLRVPWTRENVRE